MSEAVTLPVSARPAPAISNGRLGIILLIGTETILFASFIGAYLVLRMGAPSWPPAGMPVLHPGLSVFNTLLLAASTLLATRFHARTGNVRTFLGAVMTMGALFLTLQGVEFHRLNARGLTLQAGPYGALFYSLITCHALHVLGGLVLLAVALSKAGEWLGHAEIYWHFVAGVWIVLFGILYLW